MAVVQMLYSIEFGRKYGPKYKCEWWEHAFDRFCEVDPSITANHNQMRSHAIIGLLSELYVRPEQSAI